MIFLSPIYTKFRGPGGGEGGYFTGALPKSGLKKGGPGSGRTKHKLNGNRLKKILGILDKTKRWGEEWEKEEGVRKKYLVSYFSKKLHFHKRNYICTESYILVC